MSEVVEPQPAEPATKPFKPSRGFILAYTSLAVVSLAASLDAVTIGVALPVRCHDEKNTILYAAH
jgi:hypothetical protein